MLESSNFENMNFILVDAFIIIIIILFLHRFIYLHIMDYKIITIKLSLVF
jgi:hypothetical protein